MHLHAASTRKVVPATIVQLTNFSDQTQRMCFATMEFATIRMYTLAAWERTIVSGTSALTARSSSQIQGSCGAIQQSA